MSRFQHGKNEGAREWFSDLTSASCRIYEAHTKQCKSREKNLIWKNLDGSASLARGISKFRLIAGLLQVLGTSKVCCTRNPCGLESPRPPFRTWSVLYCRPVKLVFR
jgi:hypothetical protein